VVDSATKVYKGGNGTAYSSVAGGTGWTDQTVEATMKITAFGGSGSSYRAGIMARYTGGSNFYVFGLDAANNAVLMRNSSSPSGASGTCDTASSGLTSLNTQVTLKLQVSGPAANVVLKTWLNGTPVHTCTTTSSTAASGAAGVFTYGSGTLAEFDNFTVSTP
jgi:hypothetical protein